MSKTKTVLGLVICIIILLILPGMSKAEKVKVRVIAEKTNIRLKPDLQSMVIGSAPLGAILESEEQVGEWFKVSLPPDKKGYVVFGYIHSSLCEVTVEKPIEGKTIYPLPEQPPPPPTPPQPTYQPYQPSPPREIRIAVRLLGGMNYLAAGDVNEGVKGWIDAVCDDELIGYSVEGEARPIHLGFDLGGDIIIYFNPNIGIGLGAGYIQGAKTSELTFTNGYEGTFTNKSKISAIPIKLGFFFTLPMSNETSFFFNVGVGYYLSKYSFEMNYEENGYQEDMIQEASGNGFGFHGGMGFEFNFSSNVALIVGGQGRYAKIGGFEGTREHLYGTSYKEEGTLYYYELLIGAKKYPIVFIHEDEPSDPFISKVREAKVDFSGFTIMAGLIFRF